MKKLNYDFLQSMLEDGTPILLSKTIPWSEDNEEIAKREAYNGEYTIEDDGQPEPVVEPTTEDVLNAMLGVTA